MKIFVVCIDQGSYSDYRREEIAAFVERSEAEDVVASIQALAGEDKTLAEDAAALTFAAERGIALSPEQRPYYALSRVLGEQGRPTPHFYGPDHGIWYRDVYQPKIDALKAEVGKQLRSRFPLLGALEQRLPEVNFQEIIFDRYDTAEPVIAELELR